MPWQPWIGGSLRDVPVAESHTHSTAGQPHPSPAETPLDVLYIDDHLLAINKPVGLLSVPGIGPEKADCLAARAARQFPGARIVHRLDRDTSGVILLARDAATHRELSRQFHDREVRKTYIAIVHGVMTSSQGRIDMPMRKDMDPRNAPRQVIDFSEGRPAITDWWVIESMPDRSRLRLSPLTGRSHQLRLHLKEIGHPILGDDLYAPAAVLAMSPRLLLHAEQLTVTHPSAKHRRKEITFKAPCPF
jgi:tRNA pseudouridine32 synthase/23S rRNA pseudouridine746 synthase